MKRELIESEVLQTLGMSVGARSEEIETPYGKVVVRQQHRHDDKGLYALHTTVPGYFVGKSPTIDGFYKIEVETVPKEQHADVVQILNGMGYKEPISFWQ